MGVMALVVVVLLQIASATALLSLAHGWLLVGVAVVASRVAATLGCLRGLPTASGSSLGAVVAGTVPGVVGGLAVVVTGAALTGATVVADLQWWQGVAAMAALLVAVAWLLRSAVRVFGGINGDVLGASIEVGAAALLVALTIGATA
jgi:adenosylcobinamide-GDP ribazoletransferase